MQALSFEPLSRPFHFYFFPRCKNSLCSIAAAARKSWPGNDVGRFGRAARRDFFHLRVQIFKSRRQIFPALWLKNGTGTLINTDPR